MQNQRNYDEKAFRRKGSLNRETHIKYSTSKSKPTHTTSNLAMTKRRQWHGSNVVVPLCVIMYSNKIHTKFHSTINSPCKLFPTSGLNCHRYELINILSTCKQYTCAFNWEYY